MYSKNPIKTYDQYLTQLNSLGYNDYQWVSLYHKAHDENNTDVVTNLFSGSGNISIALDYDSDHYTLSQSTTDLYEVKKETAPSTKTATSPSKNDIILALADEMAKIDGDDDTSKINDYQSQISSKINNMTDEDAASLSTHYGTTNWEDIARKLLNNQDISSYTIALNDYNVTMNSTDALSIKKTETPGSTGNPIIELPDISGIASNMVVAFNSTVEEKTQAEVEAALNSKYGTDNAANNSILASMNKDISEYLKNVHSNEDTEVWNIYETLFESGSYTNNYYPTTNYDFERKNKGTCQVVYGTMQKGTGKYEYTKDENYYNLVNEYNTRKQLEGHKYVIVDNETAKSKKFVNNMLGSNLAIVLAIENGDTENMRETSVSTETSLREVNDETDLKKAEAKYEADMRRIDKKDKKYDTDLAALETERSATKEEMETLKQVARDNVDRTFKLFS